MDDSIERLCGRVQTSPAGERREVAGQILELCRESPGTVGADVDAMASALSAAVASAPDPPVDRDSDADSDPDPDDEGVDDSLAAARALSRALFEVATADRDAAERVREEALSMLADRPVDSVRIDLARVAAEGVAATPRTIGDDQIATVADLLNDDRGPVRHSAAWALELLAFARGPAVDRYRPLLVGGVDDDHDATAKHCCRALAHLQRGPADLGSSVADLRDRLDADDPALRSAAAEALGAVGGRSARRALRDREDREDSEVRVDLRQARREATLPAGGRGRDCPFEALSVDDWIAVEGDRAPLRGGRLRGVVAECQTRLDDRPAGLVARNPHEGYTVALAGEGDVLQGVFADRRRSDDLAFAVDGVERIDSDRVPLLYALEGDRLSLDLDGRARELTVTEVVVDDTGADGDAGDGATDSDRSPERRVVATDDAGHEVTFRPCGSNPGLAQFEGGRFFEIDSVTLHPREAPDEATGE